jgi:hypothetical protein
MLVFSKVLTPWQAIAAGLAIFTGKGKTLAVAG